MKFRVVCGTTDWWKRRSEFKLRVASLVFLECGAGGSVAAAFPADLLAFFKHHTIVGSDDKLAAERVRMTNSCTDELFALPMRHRGAVSRQPVGSGSGTV